MFGNNLNKQTLEGFEFSELQPSNTSGATAIPLVLNTPIPLTPAISIHADSDDAIWLTATVGWTVGLPPGATVGGVQVLFKIFRDSLAAANLIFSAKVGGQAGTTGAEERNYVTSFSHVDTNLPQNLIQHVYFLTGEIVIADPGVTATVIGPVTFTAAEIELVQHTPNPNPCCKQTFCNTTPSKPACCNPLGF